MGLAKFRDPGTGVWIPLVLGKDGVSPTVSVSDIPGGHRITITDAKGTKTIDVMDGAVAASHNQAASTITAGTFAGQVVANSSGQTPGISLLRNSRLVSAETNPTVNGEICWTYE